MHIMVRRTPKKGRKKKLYFIRTTAVTWNLEMRLQTKLDYLNKDSFLNINFCLAHFLKLTSEESFA